LTALSLLDERRNQFYPFRFWHARALVANWSISAVDRLVRLSICPFSSLLFVHIPATIDIKITLKQIHFILASVHFSSKISKYKGSTPKTWRVINRQISLIWTWSKSHFQTSQLYTNRTVNTLWQKYKRWKRTDCRFLKSPAEHNHNTNPKKPVPLSPARLPHGPRLNTLHLFLLRAVHLQELYSYYTIYNARTDVIITSIDFSSSPLQQPRLVDFEVRENNDRLVCF